MTALNRKVLRDLVQIRGQALAIVLVMACGIATFVMALTTLDSLETALDAYYAQRRFADVFAHLERAPRSLLDRVQSIPGVQRAEGRVVESVLLDMPDLAEPAVGQIVSVPDSGRPALNDVHLRLGRWPTEDGLREALVSESFARVHGLEPGDAVMAILNGRRDRLRIVGIVLSPEYIYQIRSGELLPDEGRYGIFWMREAALADAFDMDGAFNDLSLALMPGALPAEVIDRLDDLLEVYGGLGSYERADQSSNFYLTKELEELRGTATVVPAVFLAVAAFLLHVVVGRLVATQRTEIAALRALGYARGQVTVHYLKLVLLMAGAGAVIGAIAGAAMGTAMTRLYQVFFHFPNFDYRFEPWVAVLAIVVACGAALVGTVSAVSRAARQPPAEAMRPAPPARYRPTIVERLGLGRRLSPAVRMILRQIERRPIKAVMSCAAISMAVAIIVLGESMDDMLKVMIDHEFATRMRHDVQVSFPQSKGPEALAAVRRLPGVLQAEPSRVVACRLRSEHRTKRVGLQGLPDDSSLVRILDQSGWPYPLPLDGCLLSKMLAEMLHLVPGDAVTVEVLEGERPTRTLRVSGVVDDLTGIGAFARLDTVNALMRDGRESTGAYLLVDGAQVESLYAELKGTPGVSAVTVKKAALESFQSTLARMMLTMRAVNLGFAIVIAAGVVYNTVRISLSERSRDLATLRVIGFSRAEISMILLGELAVLVAIAIPMGLALGWALTGAMTGAYETEIFRLPFVVHRSTLAMAALVVAFAALVSALIVRTMLDRLDLVAVLKTRE